MLIAIRVDASPVIGMGHLMRSLTLANQASLLGARVIFICRDLSPVFAALIAENGHQLVALRKVAASIGQTDVKSAGANNGAIPADAAWLNVGWDEDAVDCRAGLRDYGHIDWLIVDHYILDARWEHAMRPVTSKIMVIDDLADRPHDCDILLDQNYYVDQHSRYQTKVDSSTILLLGPSYALLRPEFGRERQQTQFVGSFPDVVKRINICFGGVDLNGVTLKALEAVRTLFDVVDLEIDVVLGSASPHIAIVKEWAKRHRQIVLHVAPTNMAALMARADIAIGAAGSMSWERASLGLPSIAIAIADNQFKVGQDAACEGMHLFLGREQDIEVPEIKTAVILMLQNACLRKLFVNRSLSMTDGQGALRVAQKLVSRNIVIRKCTLADCDNLYQWRNADENRLNSHSSEIIPFESHQSWLSDSLKSSKRFLLIGSDAEGDVGVLRYDLNAEADYWMTSIYLVPGRHGKGLGADLLNAGLNWMSACGEKVKEIRAEIKMENQASHAVFQKAGYMPLFTTYRVKQGHHD